jgi:hypothetical protein
VSTIEVLPKSRQAGAPILQVLVEAFWMVVVKGEK